MTVGSMMSFDSAQARLRKRANKQLKQSNAEQLEKETKRMEDRIRALKEQMVKEKEEREKFGGTRWSSGKSITPNVQQPVKKKTKDKERGPRKIKILTDEPLSSYIPKKSILRESINEAFTGPSCGQCERAKATLACNECTENYCVGCFMGFHRKGALRTHTTRNLDQFDHGFIEEKEKLSSRVPKEDNRRMRASHETQEINGSPDHHKGGSLLKGTFSEEESSASFAQALKEWRSAKVKDNTWVNPADQQKAQTASCETSTSHEQLKPVDVKLNFGSNKSLTYMDRLVLKKHREGATTPRPMSQEKRKKAFGGKQGNGAVAGPLGQDDEYGINYREIFQSLGAQAAREKIETFNEIEQRYGSPLNESRAAVIIEEVSENLPGEESVCYVVESDKSDTFGQRRSTSRTGHVSIMGMTATGDFSADSEDLQPSPSGNRRDNGTSHSALGMRSRDGIPVSTRCQSASAVPRVWSPSPGYKGLSNFFLAGVNSETPRRVPKVNTSRSPSPPKRISPKILARGVWKPEESVCVVYTPDEDSELSKYPDGGPVIPLVKEPQEDRSKGLSVSPRRRKSKRDREETPEHITDFGIVDFLKASPMPSKFSEDYCDVHRVSTVSPLSLTPKPPQLHWSDDDSDDDAIIEVTSRMSMVEVADMEKEDQEAEDRVAVEDQEADDHATLQDLAWELASTTERLSREGDVEEDGVGDSCEVDSIEDDPDTGSTCSLNDVHVNSSDSMDEEERRIESRLMEREVQALK